MNTLIRIVITGVVAFFLQRILSGVHIATWQAGIWFALVLAIINAIVKPILSFISFPITFITFGLFSFVITALMVMLADKLMDSVTIDGFWWSLLFGLIMSLVSSFLENNMGSKGDS